MGAESWRELLADKNLQWEKGCSAKSLAGAWENSKGIPREIVEVLAENESFFNIELVFAFPQYEVPLKGGSKGSQNDVLTVLRTPNALSIMTVEGKAKEDFDDTISVWKTNTSDYGVKNRLSYILNRIGIEESVNIEQLRYQLFHRLASAVIMAEKLHAQNAIMIVQSFNENDSENHFSDFVDFIEVYGFRNAENTNCID